MTISPVAKNTLDQKGREQKRLGAFWGLATGDALGAPIEFYNEFQIFLRRQFPENLILVLDICNGFLNYLPRKEEFTRKTYQVKIALFAQESEERVRKKVVYLINQLLNSN